MKKKIGVLMVASMLALSACGSKQTAQTATTEAVVAETTVEETTSEEASTEESSSDADATAVDPASAGVDALNALVEIKVDKSGDTVKITLPAALYAGLTSDQIEAAVAAQYNGEITISEDGSVVVEATKEDYEAMLTKTREELQLSLDQLVIALPSVEEISVNDDFNEFTILCDGAAYSEEEATGIAMSLGLVATTYQSLNGVEKDDTYYVFDMIDGESQEVLFHSDSRE